jgi:hypothetical protein
MTTTPSIINILREMYYKNKNLDKNYNKDSDKDSENQKNNLIKNNGCCGAVSDAWLPSYPSSLADESLVSSNSKDNK